MVIKLMTCTNIDCNICLGSRIPIMNLFFYYVHQQYIIKIISGRIITEGNNTGTAIVQFILWFGDVRMEECTLKSLTFGDKIKNIDKIKWELNRENDFANNFGILAGKIFKDMDKNHKVVKGVAYHGGKDLTDHVSHKLSMLWWSG